jgi:hypothetical protein
MKAYPLAHVLIVVVMLAGCGGGESNSTKADAEPSTAATIVAAPTSRVLKGVAGIGALQSAAVTVYELDNVGRRLQPALGSTETDDAGSYELALQGVAAGALLEVEVSAVEGLTRMVCYASRCGRAKRFEVIEPPAFSLVALTELPSKGRTEVSVTAWTTMAAKRAKALASAGEYPQFARAVRQANAEVSQLVGVRVPETLSRELSLLNLSLPETAGAQKAQYTLLNAAVAELLFRYVGVEHLPRYLDRFTDALGNDGIVGSADDNFTLRELAESVRAVADSAESLNDNRVGVALANLTAQYDVATAAGLKPAFDRDLSVDLDAPRSEKIASFQEFVAHARTWIASIEALDAQQLQHAIDVEPETIETLGNSEVQSQLQFLGEVVEQVTAFILNHPDRVYRGLVEGTEEALPIRGTSGTTVGVVRLRFIDDHGLQVGLVGEVTGEANTTFAPFELTLKTGIGVGALRTAHDDLNERSAIDVTEALESSYMQLAGSIAEGAGRPGISINEVAFRYELTPAMRTRDADALVVSGVFKSLSLVGDVTIRNRGALFSGRVEVDLDRFGADAPDSDGGMDSFFAETLRLAGDFVSASGAHSFSTSVQIHVESALAADTFAWAEVGNDRRYISGRLPSAEPIYALASPNMQRSASRHFFLSADLGRDSSRTGNAHFFGYSIDNVQSLESYATCIEDALKDISGSYSGGSFEHNPDFSDGSDLVSDSDLTGDSDLTNGPNLNSDSNLDSDYDLEAIGEGIEPIPSLKAIEDACAVGHLNAVYETRDLDSAVLAELESLVREQLEAKFGKDSHLTEGLELDALVARSDENGGIKFKAIARYSSERSLDAYRNVAFTVSSRVNLPDLRASQVAATLSTVYPRGARLRADVWWGSGSYAAIIDIDDTCLPQNLRLHVFNAQGHELNVNVSLDEAGELGDVTGEVLLRGEKLGHVELRRGLMPLIVYNNTDETILESLF